jgi:hypothetical protein
MIAWFAAICFGLRRTLNDVADLTPLGKEI